MDRVQHFVMPAMGTTARVTVVGGLRSLADDGRRRLIDLEATWSRFRPTSELSRMNASAGSPCIVGTDTFHLVDRLVRAWRDTHGRFDPTVFDAVVALGYDRTWPFASSATHDHLPSAPGCAGIRLDAPLRLVWLPEGVHLDPGGLGKGLAADLVAEELMTAGAAGVMVDLGGDVRVIGESPHGSAWRIGVEHPLDPDDTIAVVETTDGGVATSSRHKRRWRTDDDIEVHHVIDPATAHPVTTPWVTATALAANAADAEVGATVALLDGEASTGVFAALLADHDGTTTVVGPHPALFRELKFA